MDERKTIKVVAAILINDGRVFATQRGYGEWKDWWEFPGGKIEDGENGQEALRREILEELATHMEVGRLLTTVEHDYPAFHLSMQCYECRVLSGHLSLLEHESALWLSKDELSTINWLPADSKILPVVQSLLP